MTFPLAEFLRQCDAVKAGALDDLDCSSLALVREVVEGTHQKVRKLHTDKFVQRQLGKTKKEEK
jgi:hypothetical protein